MNRLQSMHAAGHVASTLKSAASAPRQVGTAKFSMVRGSAPCSLFAPLHYERNYAYPLLVWLHGPRDSEEQLKRVMPLVSLRNYVGVGIRGTCASPHGSREVYDWSQSPADMALAEQRLCDGLDAASQRFHVSPSKIFLAGFQSGGTTAFRLAMSHPERFAGVLSIGGAFPAGQTPLKRLAESRRLPLFLACGRDSRRYAPERVCDDLRLFHTAGMNVALRQYPCGDELTTLMLSDMDRWMMEQITAARSCVAS